MKLATDAPALRLPLSVILGGLAALILFQQFVELPGTSMLMLALNNAAHTPFFTVLTLLLWQLHPLAPPRYSLKQQLQVLAITMVFLATATELMQTITIRDASFEDWLRNLLGIGAGFCFIVAWQFRKQMTVTRQLASVALGIVLMGFAFRDVITIVERYERRLDALPHLLIMEQDYLRGMTRRFDRWEVGNKAAFYVQVGRAIPSGPERAALLLKLDRGSYPGLTLREPYPDWRQFESLVIEAESLDDTPLGMTLRVETRRDRGMNNAWEFFLPPEPTMLRVPLEMLIEGSGEKRTDIRNLLLFTDGERESNGMLLYDLRLE